MTKLTANTHGYEFELMPHVVIQYDASMIGDIVHVDSSSVVIQAPTVEAAYKATQELYKLYDDEVSVLPAIKEHFINQVF